MSIACPKCESKAFKRNGFTRHGKQNHRCLDCGRQFSIDVPEMPRLEEENKSMGEVFSDRVSSETRV